MVTTDVIDEADDAGVEAKVQENFLPTISYHGMYEAEKHGESAIGSDTENIRCSNVDSGETIEAMIEIDENAKSPAATMSKFRTLFNLLVLSFAFLFQFSAYISFENLQSSLNHEEGLGTTGLAVLYGMFIVTSLFVTPIVMALIGAKLIIGFSMVSYLLFIATGFYATWATVIPATAVVGIGAAHLWISQQDYIGILAQRYAVVTGTKAADAVNMFFGIFYGIFMVARILGNLLSSVIFTQDGDPDDKLLSNMSGVSPYTDEVMTSSCGADFCAYSLSNSTVEQLRPPKYQVDIFSATCLGLSGVAVTLIMVLLSRTTAKHSEESPSELSRSVVRHIISSRDQQLLFIPAIFRGLLISFLQGDVTVAFVSCPYGVENVGFVMITQGVVCSIGSVVLGKLAKYTGWLPLFILSFVVQLSVCIAFLLWKPVPTDMYVIFILVALLSSGDIVYIVGLSAIHTVHFTSTAAFPCFRLCMSLGQLLAFGYSSHLCMRIKTYVIIGVVTISTVCIILFFRRKSVRSKLTMSQES